VHDIDKVEGGLIVLFFGLVFSSVPPENFSTDALGSTVTDRYHFTKPILMILKDQILAVSHWICYISRSFKFVY